MKNKIYSHELEHIIANFSGWSMESFFSPPICAGVRHSSFYVGIKYIVRGSCFTASVVGVNVVKHRKYVSSEVIETPVPTPWPQYNMSRSLLEPNNGCMEHFIEHIIHMD